MLDKRKLTLYPPLNLESPKIPKRSDLYPLEPIGIGTPYCESLVSYVIRLAYEHRVSVKTLIKEISHKTPLIIYPVVMANNDDLSNFVFELERRTMQPNLQCLTMLNWSKVIRPFQLYKKTLSWCPVCYHKWKKQNQTLYLPIIWLIAEVKVCPIHRCILLQECFECGYLIKSITKNYTIGYCPQCKAWLGYSNNDKRKKKGYKSSPLVRPLTQSYIINNLRDLIEINPAINYCLLTDRIRHILSNSAFFEKIRISGILMVDNEPRQTFLKEINLSISKFRAFYKDKYVTSPPSLITLLKLTHYCKISLVNLLFQDYQLLISEIESNIEIPDKDTCLKMLDNYLFRDIKSDYTRKN